MYDRPSEPFNVTAYVHHATWVNLTEIHCEIAPSDPHRNYLGAVERAERTPSIVAADRTAKALGTTLAEMFTKLERGPGDGG